MEIRKVVKLPIPIEVVAVTEESVHDVAEWCGGKTTDMGIAIDTLEGPVEAVIDQHHVAKGVKGEFYPIRNDVLAESYKDAPLGGMITPGGSPAGTYSGPLPPPPAPASSHASLNPMNRNDARTSPALNFGSSPGVQINFEQERPISAHEAMRQRDIENEELWRQRHNRNRY